jgi:HAD superfamily hydrolase (TIGR01509 family)
MARVPIRAVLFDLDGTLIDSEPCTDRAIREAMARRGEPNAGLPSGETRGRTWTDIVRALLAKYPSSGDPALLERELLGDWIEFADSALPIAGAADAVRAARARGDVAIVSSSPVSVIDRLARKLGVAELVPESARIGAELVTRPKPDPQPYRIAAARLSVAPEACLVFEDSVAGLESARRAGMRTVAVVGCSAEVGRCRALADAACHDYRALPSGFFLALSEGALELASQYWT